MKIQKLPDYLGSDRAILWQYSNAERLKKIARLFTSLLHKCAIEPWERIIKSMNLDVLEYKTWQNFAFRNNKAGGGRYILFRPRFLGMGNGDAIRYVIITKTNTTVEPYNVPTGTYKITIAKGTIEIEDGMPPTANITEVVAESEDVYVENSARPDRIKFLMKGKEAVLSPNEQYIISFMLKVGDNEYSPTKFGVSLYVNATTNTDDLCYVNNVAIQPTWQPIVEFEWLNKEMRETEEKTLSLISTTFGIPNPGYVIGEQSGISLDTWRRYVQSQIYLMDSNGSMADLNKWIKSVMPDANCRITDGLDMTIDYKFAPALVDEDKQLSELPGFFPAPAGVYIGESITPPDNKFGLVIENVEERPPLDSIGGLDSSRFANDSSEQEYIPQEN